MKTVVIANPQAAAGKVGRHWGRYERAILDRFGESQIKMTSGAGDATRLTRAAADEGADHVVLVGGDGTIGEAVNGLFRPENEKCYEDLPTVVFLPAGTGGDYARSLGLRELSPGAVLQTSSPRPIDVGRVDLTGANGEPVTRYFINIASFGSSGLIVEKVNNSSKILGGQASFLIGTLKGLLSWRDRRIRLRVDDTFDEELTINTVAVANGRYFGGGMKVAPLAIVDDGQFDITVIGGAGLVKFIRHSGKIYRGTHLSMPGITAIKGKVVTAEAADDKSEPIPVETDGELPGNLPLRCTILPHALQIMAPWPRAEASEAD